MAFGALGSLVLWVTVGRRMMLRYAGRSVINALLDPDEDTKEALHVILAQAWNWFLTPSIKHTRKVQSKDDQGNLSEAEETFSLSPLQELVGEIGRFTKMQFLASKGGDAKAMKEALQAAGVDPTNPNASSLSGVLAGALDAKGGLNIPKAIIGLIGYLNKKEHGGSGGAGGSW